ncbi:50S ribosomal protein L15 [Candidatus Woesearchaeota archaeon]|jgi:large subunit ribosomal protein L15|nr:50S ribosomal protein L15 [Candidatus Woesearchaeota archaeon]
MVVNKRKKDTRQRAGTTHGYGSMKKNRGAGHRGGRGNAGSGKRGDAKKPRYWKSKYFGKSGFHSVLRKNIVAINLRSLELSLEKFVSTGIIAKKGETYTIDLNKLGYNKLLGTGKATKKLNITVDYCSAKAQQKVEDAGGKLEILEQSVLESASESNSPEKSAEASEE